MYNKTKTKHEMETIVELYFDKELSDITFETDKLDEWKKINKELGLTNQLKLAKGSDSPVPFPYINESMNRVYSILCPEKVSIHQYNKTPIPLEVLQQISFCKKENHFNGIQIWFDDKSPAPLAVGLICKYYFYPKDGDTIEVDSEEEAKNHSEYQKNTTIYQKDANYYLIAKWGDVKKSFKELKEMAIERFIEKHGAKMKNDIDLLKTRLNNINEGATLYFLGEISETKATSTSDW